MGILKQILIAFITFALIIFFFSLLLPSKISLSRSVLIHASKERVTEALLNVSQWKNWNPILQDSGVHYVLEGPNLVKWISNKGIPNSIQLHQVAPDSIQVVIQSGGKPVFTSGFTVVSHTEDSLFNKVEWWVREDVHWYPWEKFFGLFSERSREAYMDDNLQSLKYHLENE